MNKKFAAKESTKNEEQMKKTRMNNVFTEQEK